MVRTRQQPVRRARAEPSPTVEAFAAAQSCNTHHGYGEVRESLGV